MGDKLLSVIIPTKNRSTFLKKCVETFKIFDEIETIVVDDQSNKVEKEENIEICSVNQIKYFENTLKKGAPSARNYGASLSNGEYLWFFDDDDYVSEETLIKLIKILKKDKSDIHLMSMNIINKSKNVVKTVVPLTSKNNYNYYRKKGHQVNTSCMIFKREIFNKFKWDIDLVSGQDTDLILRASHRANINCLGEEYIVNVVIDHQDRITKNISKQMLGKKQFYKKHKDVLTIQRKFYYLFTYFFRIPYLKSVIKWK